MSTRRRLFQGASWSPAILLLVAFCVLQVAHMVNGEFFPAGTTVAPSIKSGLGWCRPPPFCYARPRIQDPYDCENYSDCCGRRVSATKCGAGSTCNVGCKPGYDFGVLSCFTCCSIARCARDRCQDALNALEAVLLVAT
jgi:hypothetical protein